MVALLLACGVATQLLCCLGVLRMRTVFDRLHYLAPASFIGPVLVAASVIVHAGSLQASLKAAGVALILTFTGPIVTHALARAAHTRLEIEQ